MSAPTRKIILFLACWLCVQGAWAGYGLPESGEVSNGIRREYGDRAHLTKALQAEGLTFENFRQRILAGLVAYPDHDWSIKIGGGSYGLQGFEKNPHQGVRWGPSTVLRFGSHSKRIPLPFYGSVTVGAAMLCAIVLATLLLLRPKNQSKQESL